MFWQSNKTDSIAYVGGYKYSSYNKYHLVFQHLFPSFTRSYVFLYYYLSTLDNPLLPFSVNAL